MITVSFFSYKGGAGRTSLMFNTLPYIAKKLNATEREPIVVLDLDLDSKGLSYLIGQESGINSIQVLRGDSAIGFRTQANLQEHPFFSKLVPIGSEVGLDHSLDRSILFVSAHSKEGAETLGDSNYDGSNLSLSTLRKLCKQYNCKAIVMDTPAGNQISGECALSLSKKIVVTMRITNQFRMGTKEFLKIKSTQYSGKEYILVPNAVPSTDNTPYSMENIMHSIKLTMRESVGNENEMNETIIDMNGINEVNRFKFNEESLLKLSKDTELSEDEQRALESYKILADVIAGE